MSLSCTLTQNDNPLIMIIPVVNTYSCRCLNLVNIVIIMTAFREILSYAHFSYHLL